MPEPHAPVRAAALEELTRPPARRALFRRPPLLSADSDGGSAPVLPRWVVLVGSAVLVGALVVGWGLVRRPAPADSTLPHASDATAASSPGTGSPGAAPSVSSTSAAPPPAGGGPSTAAAGAGDSVTVHVAGAVVRPGVVSLPAGSRAVDAVAAAGGMVPGADPDRVNLAAKLVDGQRLAIPLVGQPAPAEAAPNPAIGAGSGPPGSGAPAAPVDLNTATAEQLDALPGVGPATAAAIIAHRTEHGPFRSVDGLLDVRGIGDAKLDSLRGAVTVGGS